MKQFQRYFDAFGLLAKSSTWKRDGGDTAQRTGMYYAGIHLRGERRGHHASEFLTAIDKLSKPDGRWRRHPDERRWYSDYDRMSRDQMTPIIIALGYYKFNTALSNAFWLWVRSGFFMYNTKRNGATKRNHGKKKYRSNPNSELHNYDDKLPDFAPTFAGLYIRAFRSWYYYPLLIILDLELVVSALHKVFQGPRGYSNRTGDDLNFIVRLLQAKTRLQTPLGFIARLIYKRRPHLRKFHKQFDFKTDNAVLSTMEYYCRPSKGDPPLHLLYKELIEEAF